MDGRRTVSRAYVDTVRLLCFVNLPDDGVEQQQRPYQSIQPHGVVLVHCPCRDVLFPVRCGERSSRGDIRHGVISAAISQLSGQDGNRKNILRLHDDRTVELVLCAYFVPCTGNVDSNDILFADDEPAHISRFGHRCGNTLLVCHIILYIFRRHTCCHRPFFAARNNRLSARLFHTVGE